MKNIPFSVQIIYFRIWLLKIEIDPELVGPKSYLTKYKSLNDLLQTGEPDTTADYSLFTK